MRILLFLAFSAVAFGQTTPLQFEVASVKPAGPQEPGRFSVRVSQDRARITYSNVTLRMVLSQAYKVKQSQISCPDWMNTERYDINAKIPDAASKDDVPPMIQALLAERFKLVAHREEKVGPVYALVVGKNGAKMKPAEPEAKRDPDAPPPPPMTGKPGAPPPGGVRMMMGPKGRKLSGDMTMERLADSMSDFLDRPVVDETKTPGKFAVELEWSPEPNERLGMFGPPMMRHPAPNGEKAPEAEASEAPPIFTAVQEQLGLRLESKKGPTVTIIVEKAEKVPTEN